MSHFILIYFLFSISGCNQKNPHTENIEKKEKVLFLNRWDMTRAERLESLPSTLSEISGLSLASNGLLAAIEDENGSIYFLDSTFQVIRKHTFASQGDYEAIACSMDECLVAKSNEKVFRVGLEDGSATEKIPFTIKGACEIESLEILNDSLITCCKSGQKGTFYSVNPSGESQKLFKLSKKDITEFLKSNKPRLLERIAKTKNWVNPSDLTISESNQQLLVINSVSRLLIAINLSDYQISDIVLLDQTVFRQPEGIAIDQNGNLIIASEGAGASAVIARFATIN